MKPLNNREILQLWDQGYSLHPLDQGLLALATALPEHSPSALADWSLGRRNQALVQMRCACFGAQLAAWTSCSKCAEKLEFELDASLLAQGRKQADAEGPAVVLLDGQSFRLPTSRDLSRVAAIADAEEAARQLAAACRTSPVATSALPALEELGQQMSSADPMAEIAIELACPLCGHRNNAILDIANFLWAEIEAHAKRLLRDVHQLASAYGWSEREVLGLSENRRAAYLDMVYG